MLILKLLKKLQKNVLKKVIVKNVIEIFSFSTFTENQKNEFAYNFSWGHLF